MILSYRCARKRAVTLGLLMFYLSVAGPSLPAWQQQERRGDGDTPKAPNRSLPTVKAPVLAVRFDEAPSTEDLVRSRVLPTPLRPANGAPSPEENRDLARALERFAESPSAATLEEFLTKYPTSPWRAAVLVNVGRLQWREGYFSRAAKSWDEAWELTKESADRAVRDLAEVALAEWLTQAMTFGHVEALQRGLDDVDTRAIGGPAGNKVMEAREGLWQLTNHHELALFSGPEALKALLAVANKDTAPARDTIAAYHPPHEGTSLVALQELSRRVGFPLEMRFVTDATEIPLPAIVHLKSEHYSAVIARRDDAVVLRDPALGGEVAMSVAALRDEASGYVLIPASAAQSTGRAVDGTEGERVFGHCMPGLPGEDECGCGSGPAGMPTYSLHPSMAAIVVTDTPLTYTPPRGPAMPFTLRYNHRSSRLDPVAASSHVGPLWSFDWLSYVQDNNTMLAPPWAWTHVVLRGEGIERYTGYVGGTHWRSRATLVQVAHNPPRYERRLPDGTVEVFTFPDRAASLPNRKIFLTEVIDPQGHTQTFTYDASFRVVAVTDAVGQVTTLAYDDPVDPLLVTKVTDPFGRTAVMSYDGTGRLTAITDAIGMTSRFAYDESDFLTSMTTPYGITTFRRGPDSLGALSFRRVEATDPEGGTERLEYRLGNMPGLPAAVPAGEVPAGFEAWNQDMDKWNSFYWSKQAMAEAPGDLSRAVITRWLLYPEMYAATAAFVWTWNIPHSVKRPLETRVWYRYPGQGPTVASMAGTGRSPTLIARVLEGGATQLTQLTYNSQGRVTSRIDPLGRQTTYTYAANGLDLLEMRQVTGSGTDLLASYAGYNAQHLPATVTDAAGQTTTTTYNAAGQPLTVTNAKNETTTYAYDTSGMGYVLSATGPVAGATITFTYDALGRTRTVSDPDGYAVTTDYDALNRITKRTYPDTTFEQYVYQRLDVVEERDRKGRTTRHFYNGVGRRTATRDPLGRVIRQDWCPCGVLEALIDANGNRTSWERDAQGRITREVRADAVTDTLYAYDATGRLKTVTDPKNQVTTHTYLSDDSLLSTAYTNAVIATPGVNFTYDSVYPRVATMVDGIGTTTYTYKAPGQLGAGLVATVDGPLSNDVIGYAYDELGRATTRTINGSANSVTWSFDALGRVAVEANVLGTFTSSYDGVSSRLVTVTYPNGQTSAYSYLPNHQDQRLQTIHHKYPGGATLSKFDYTYDAVGNIVTWQQQTDSNPAVLWTYGYDTADQLTSATEQSTGGTPATLKRFAYGYDPAGNRTFERIDDEVTTATHDSMNRLQTHAPGGPLQFAGIVNEPAIVSVQGVPAAVDGTNNFRGASSLPNGTNTVSVVATDPSGNQTTRQYQVDVTGGAKTFTYDPNGNLISDGTRTFEWDARNQLVAVNVATHRSEFTYDGLQRRVRAIDKETGVVQSDTRVLWCEMVICEERATDGVTVTRQAFTHGEQVGGAARFFAADHLGSVTDVADSSATLLGRYAYDAWGRRTVTAGTEVTKEAFTGHRWHSSDSLFLTFYRGYDPDLGIWISEDPMGLSEGPNLYRYVAGNPIRYQDPLGLAINCTVSSIREQLVGGKCPSGAGACTDATMRASATGCRQSSCGTWSFTGTVDIRYAITYVQPKRSRGADGNPYETHEWLHIGDMQGWCSGISSKYPSEGFGSVSECNAARTKFLSEVRRGFQDARNNSNKSRD
jgi:RHS repeat-associated protein